MANLEQLRKVKEVWEECPSLEFAVLLNDDESGVDGERVLSFEDLMAQGRSAGGDAIESGLKEGVRSLQRVWPPSSTPAAPPVLQRARCSPTRIWCSRRMPS